MFPGDQDQPQLQQPARRDEEALDARRMAGWQPKQVLSHPRSNTYEKFYICASVSLSHAAIS